MLLCVSKGRFAVDNNLRRQISVKAFSLVEVTLALGVVAFAFVTMTALLSVSMVTLTASRDLTLEVQIGQRLITEARETSFSNLSAFAQAGTQYFDMEGNPSSSPTGTDHVYKAVVIITYTTGLSVNATATTTTDIASANAASVSITISKVSNPAFPKTVSVCVANNGF